MSFAKIIILVLLTVQFAFATDYTKGEGEFISKESDSLSFVKKQLLHESFLDILIQEMGKIGLNGELFKQKYNEKLFKKYEFIENTLKNKLKITDASTEAQKEKFYDELRNKKLALKRRFLRIQKVISSYRIKKMGRKRSSSDHRFIKIEGRVDQKSLSELYFKVVRDTIVSGHSNLKLHIDFELENFTYTELEVENKKEFTHAIADSSLKWFQKNKPSNIPDVSLLDAKEKKTIDDTMWTDSNSELAASVLLDIKVKIIKDFYDEELELYRFRILTNAYLRDLSSMRIVDVFKFPTSKLEYTSVKGRGLAQRLVSEVYKGTSSQFRNIRKTISKITQVVQKKSIKITGKQKIKDIAKIVDLLNLRGMKLSVDASISEITPGQSKILVYFDGQEEGLRVLFRELKTAKKAPNFVIIDEEGGFGVKLLEEQTPATI